MTDTTTDPVDAEIVTDTRLAHRDPSPPATLFGVGDPEASINRARQHATVLAGLIRDQESRQLPRIHPRHLVAG